MSPLVEVTPSQWTTFIGHTRHIVFKLFYGSHRLVDVFSLNVFSLLNLPNEDINTLSDDITIIFFKIIVKIKMVTHVTQRDVCDMAYKSGWYDSQ